MTKTAGSVVVLGSLHYDIIVEAPHQPAVGETVTGSHWFPKFGGKGGNQAVAARLHGADVRLIGSTGDDDFAEFLQANLTQAGLSTEYILPIADAPTGMSVAIQNKEGDYGAVIVSGANLMIPPEMIDNPLIWENAAVLVLQNEVAESINIVAAKKAQSLGMIVCLNAAPARPMSAELSALTDILIVNAIEAEALGSNTVSSLDSAALAAEQLAANFSTVIVTAGGAGVAAASGNTEKIKIPAKSIDVISTHGAGDRFTGVLCAELAAEKPLAAAIAIANERAADFVAGC